MHFKEKKSDLIKDSNVCINMARVISTVCLVIQIARRFSRQTVWLKIREESLTAIKAGKSNLRRKQTLTTSGIQLQLFQLP